MSFYPIDNSQPSVKVKAKSGFTYLPLTSLSNLSDEEFDYGADCLFFKYLPEEASDTIGAKLYGNLKIAEQAYYLQSALAYLGFAPAVFNKIRIDYGPIRLFGFQTEIAKTIDECIEDDTIDDFDALIENLTCDLESLNIEWRDCHDANVGILADRAVIIDCAGYLTIDGLHNTVYR